MSKHKSLNPLLLYIPVHLAVVVVTWRDIARRSEEQLRGKKRLWRFASAVNTLGAVAYWLAARRSPAQQ